MARKKISVEFRFTSIKKSHIIHIQTVHVAFMHNVQVCRQTPDGKINPTLYMYQSNSQTQRLFIHCFSVKTLLEVKNVKHPVFKHSPLKN